MATSDDDEFEDTECPGHRLVGELGRGSFAQTKLFTEERTGEHVAVKLIDRAQLDENLSTHVLREVRNMMRLTGHPVVLRFHEVFFTPKHLGISMEPAKGGDLFGRLAAVGRFPEPVARYFFQQLICGLAWCHSKGVCHRDLKLRNLLLDRPVSAAALHDPAALRALQPHVKICDFGCSKSSELDSLPQSVVGTPAFMAPETLRERNYDGEKADVWSCGVTLFFMLTGELPFEGPLNQRRTIQRILAGDYSVPDGVEVSKGCRDLLDRMLEPDPGRRISVPGIQRHPWFRQDLPPELRRQLPVAARHSWLPWPRKKKGAAGTAELPPPRQSEEEVERLVRQACLAGRPAQAPRLPVAPPVMAVPEE